MARTEPRAAEQADAQRERALQAQIDRLTLTGTQDGTAAPAPRGIRRILACVSGAPSSEHVLAWTSEIGRLFGAEVTLFHATDPAPDLALYPGLGAMGFGAPIILPEETEDLARRADESLAVARRLVERDVANVSTLRREGHAGHEIVRAARELESDLVIMGPHEGGIVDRALLGSTSDHVKDHVETSVLFARTVPAPGRVVCAVDGSRASRVAAGIADSIALRWHEPLELFYAAPKRWAPAFADATQPEGERTPAHAMLEFGNPRELVLARVRDRPPALLACGARGMSGIRSLVPGRVSTHLARESPTSVLVARAP